MIELLIAYAIATTFILIRIAYKDWKRQKFQQEVGRALQALAKRGQELIAEAKKETK